MRKSFMKRLSVLIGLLCFVMIASLVSQDATKKQFPATKKQFPAKTEKKAKVQETAGIQGTVVCFNDFVLKGSVSLTKEEAMKYVENGEALALLVGDPKDGKVYFVFDKKGAIQSQKLAELAGKPVSVVGEELNKNGVLVLIAKSIKPVG